MLRTLLGLGAVATFAVTANAQIVINEIRIDQPSTDDDECFELAGPVGASLAGLWYVSIGDGTGGSGVVETALDLSAHSINAAGFFVGAEATWTGTFGTADFLFTATANDLNFENSDNVTHLLVTDFTGAVGDDLDVDEDGVIDGAPWTAVVDSVGLLETPGSGDLLYSDTIVGPDGSFVPGHVHRHPGGASTLSSWNIGDFGGANVTAGSANGIGNIADAFGGKQVLQLDFGPAEAGNLHLVLATASGTAPGLFVDGVAIPLNPDGLTTLSITKANTPSFAGTLGFLDGAGTGSAAINVPGGLGLVGLTVDSVAITLDLGLGGQVSAASNPTTFTIL